MTRKGRKTATRKRTNAKTVAGKNATPGVFPYLYVEARGWFKEVERLLEPSFQILDGPISFDSIQLLAGSMAQAYELGPALLQERQSVEQGGDPHLTGTLLNNYVVQL